ncbi:ABC transporter permease [Saprospiraceae bacterium]|nr:ABC transporter permease [Saprospiraceae bacterium]
MFKLLKLEYSKFRKSTVIILLTTMFAVFFPFSLTIGKLLKGLPPVFPSEETIVRFSGVWEYLGYAGNWMVFFFLGVMIVYTITLEVSYKTLRQSIIIGMTRQQYFTSKILLVLIISLFATLYYTIIALVVGWINTPDADISLAFTNEWAIPRFYLMSVGYLSFAMMIAFLIRNSGLAVFLYLSIVLLVEPLIRLGHFKFLGPKFQNYYPLNCIEDNMPLPLLKMADYIKSSELDLTVVLSYKMAALMSVGYIIVFIGISYYNFIKRDL